MFDQQQVYQSKIDITVGGNSISIDGTSFPITVNIMSQDLNWEPVFWDTESDVSIGGEKRSNIRGYDLTITLDYDRMLEPNKLTTILDGLAYAKNSNYVVRFYPDATDDSTSFVVIPTGSTKRLLGYDETVFSGEQPTLAFESQSILSQVASSGSSSPISDDVDADTLDGLDSVQFLRSDVDDTFTGGTLTIDGLLDLNQNRIADVATPVNNTDAATKGYVDGEIGSLGDTYYTESEINSFFELYLSEADLTDGDEDLYLNNLQTGGYIDVGSFAEGSEPAHNAGRLFYNEGAEALSYYNDQPEVTINIGQESVLRCRNVEGSTIEDGDVVFISGSSGDNPQVQLARADVESTIKPSLGLVTQETIGNNSVGYITTFGRVRNLDTSAWTAGDTLYISPSTAGELTNVQPTYPNFAYRVGYVVRSHASEGVIFVDIERDIDVYDTDNVLVANGNGRIGQDSSFTWDGSLLSVGGQGTFSGLLTAQSGLNVVGGGDLGGTFDLSDAVLRWDQDTDDAEIEIIDYGSDADWLTITTGDTPEDRLRIRNDDLGTITNTADFGGNQITLYRDTVYHNSITSDNFAEAAGLFTGFDLSQSEFKAELIRANELRVKAFVAEVSAALYGEDILTKSRGVLSRNFTVPSVGSTETLYVEDLEGLENTQVFEDGDWVRMKVVDRSGGGLQSFNVWGKVTSYSDLSGGEQSWTFTRESGGSATTGDVVYEGSVSIDYGVSGDSVIVRSVIGDNTPRDTQLTWTTSPINAGNYEIVTRTGILDDITDATGAGFYSENAYLTNSLLVGDLSKAGDYLEYASGNLNAVLNELDITIDSDNFIVANSTGLDISAETFDLLAANILIDSANDRVKLGDSTNYFDWNAGSIDLAVDTFNLSTTGLSINSDTPEIVVGNTFDADGSTNTGTLAGWDFNSTKINKSNLQFISDNTGFTGLFDGTPAGVATVSAVNTPTDFEDRIYVHAGETYSSGWTGRFGLSVTQSKIQDALFEVSADMGTGALTAQIAGFSFTQTELQSANNSGFQTAGIYLDSSNERFSFGNYLYYDESSSEFSLTGTLEMSNTGEITNSAGDFSITETGISFGFDGGSADAKIIDFLDGSNTSKTNGHVRGNKQTIADDSAARIVLKSGSVFGASISFIYGRSQLVAAVYWTSDTNPIVMFTGANAPETGAGVPTGTTGTDGNWGIYSHDISPDQGLWIENRMGSEREFTCVSFFS